MPRKRRPVPFTRPPGAPGIEAGRLLRALLAVVSLGLVLYALAALLLWATAA